MSAHGVMTTTARRKAQEVVVNIGIDGVEKVLPALAWEFKEAFDDLHAASAYWGPGHKIVKQKRKNLVERQEHVHALCVLTGLRPPDGVLGIPI